MKTRLLLIIVNLIFVTANSQSNFHSAYTFTGLTDTKAILVPNNGLNTSAMTFEAWIKIKNQSDGILMSSTIDSGWVVYIQHHFMGHSINFGKKNVFEYKTGDDAILDTDTGWHHIAISYECNNGNYNFYIDGNRVNASSFGPGCFNSLGGYSIGGDTTQGSQNYFAGDLDEIRIWNVIRSQNEIQNNKCRELTNFSNLVAYYQFNDTIGFIVSDKLGNSDGISNFIIENSYIPSVPCQICQCTTNMLNEEKRSNLSFYPNPSNGYITLTNLETDSMITVTDIIGNILIQKKSQGINCEIDISNLCIGVYFINNMKFVKE